MDEKGRFQIPTKYRDAIAARCQGRLFITLAQQCLDIYMEPDWLAIEQAMQSLPAMDSKVQRATRLYLGNAHDVGMDNNGRVLLPTGLRELLQLDRKLALVGLGEKFELWDDDAWRSETESARATSFDAIAGHIAAARAAQATQATSHLIQPTSPTLTPALITTDGEARE